MKGPRTRIRSDTSYVWLGARFAFVVLAVFWTVIPNVLMAGITNRIVAIVNADIITLHELESSMERITGVSVEELQARDDGHFHEIRRAVLDSLINEKLTKQQVMKLGITVVEKDVEEAIEKIKSEANLTQEELVYSLAEEGITLEEYKEKIRGEIERFKLMNYEVQSKIVVTEEEAKQYYLNHKEHYTEMPEIRLARILLKVGNPNDKEEVAHTRERGGEILARLRKGEDFCSLARTYSQGPGASEGGDLGCIKLSQLEPTLREKIARLSSGECTGIEACESGFQIIKLVEQKEGGVKPFDRVRGVIYSKLFRDKVEKKYAQWLKGLRDESFIKIKF